MGTRTSSLIISHHAGPGLTQGPGIQFTGAQDPAHRGLGSSSWGLGIQLTGARDPTHGGSGSSSWGLGIQLMGARDPAHMGSESSIWRLRLLPASDLAISASFHSKRQRGQEVHQRPDGLVVRPDDHPIWKSRPAAALCSMCLLSSVQACNKMCPL